MLQFHPVHIDLSAVARSLGELLGRQVTSVEAMVHLRSEGLIPYGEGWLVQHALMAALERLLHGAPEPSGQAA